MNDDSLVRTVIIASPLGTLLGIQAESIETDHVRLRLPFRTEVTTVADLVHGGSISALVDTAATAAAWSGADPGKSARGTTIGFSINFLAGARGQDIIAEASVLRRGRTICVIDVHVQGVDGTSVARAMVTYKLG